MFCSSCAGELPSRPPVECPRCGVQHWANAKPCGGALVTNPDGRLLLVRRAHEPYAGLWDIPGGYCDEREHPADAAVREVREETGLEIETGDLVGMWIDDYGDTGQVTLNIYFHARVTGGEPTLEAAEVTELGWFAPDELPGDGDLAFPEHEPVVIAAWRDGREEVT